MRTPTALLIAAICYAPVSEDFVAAFCDRITAIEADVYEDESCPATLRCPPSAPVTDRAIVVELAQ